MSSTMKAFVMEAVGKVAVVEKPIPEPGPTDAKGSKRVAGS